MTEPQAETLPDRLSALPDKILIHILSFLPSTKSRARTTVLAKRWYDLWTVVPFLDFPYESPDIDAHHGLVDRCLELYRGTDPLARFLAEDRCRDHDALTEETCAPVRSLFLHTFERWIRFALLKSVSELSLWFDHPFPYLIDNPKLPPAIFDCGEILTSLKLNSCWFPNNPKDFKGFPKLKTLYLRCMLFTRTEHFNALLNSCTSLEHLVLESCHWVPNIIIRSGSFDNLISLKFENHLESSPDGVGFIAPNLRYLDYTGRWDTFYIRADCPKIVGVHIRATGYEMTNCEHLLRVMRPLTNAQILVVSYWFFPQYTQLDKRLCKDYSWCKHEIPTFANLRQFHIHGIVLTKNTLRETLLFIYKCPHLEKLCINLDFHRAALPTRELRPHEDEDFMDDCPPEDFGFYYSLVGNFARLSEKEKAIHRELLTKLKLVSITMFPDDENCMKLVEVLLGRVPNLERVRLNFIRLEDDDVPLEQIQQQVTSFHFAAPDVQIEVWETAEADFDEQCRDWCNPIEDVWRW